MRAKRIMPCIITYKIENGYSTKLEGIVTGESVRVCKLKEDGSIDYKLDKDQYFVSDLSMIHLPLYLNKEETVLIDYEKETDAEWVYLSSSNYPTYINTGTSTFGSWTL